MWQKEAPQNHVVLSTLLQKLVVLFPISEPRGPLPFPSEPRGSLYLLQNRVAPYLLQSRMVYSTLWLPGLGLNPSAHLPLQPHF